MNNKWHQLEDFPDYAISEEGEVISLKTDQTRKHMVNQQGVRSVVLYDENQRPKNRSVAVLVANAFVPREADFFDTPIHLDGDRANCAALNLMWRPRWFAIKYHKQFDESMFKTSRGAYRIVGDKHIFRGLCEAATTLGVYYHDVFESAHNGTPVFPGNLYFESL